VITVSNTEPTPVTIRVRLVSTTDEYTELKAGDEGVLKGMTMGLGQNPDGTPKGMFKVEVDWDSGSNLALIYPDDQLELKNPLTGEWELFGAPRKGEGEDDVDYIN
jgi:hypothetical protein